VKSHSVSSGLLSLTDHLLLTAPSTGSLRNNRCCGDTRDANHLKAGVERKKERKEERKASLASWGGGGTAPLTVN
jgi:hypothetical protein